ncbi:MAG: GtrA family protein [Lachnospiraceae bacterium]|nr:GtrA family protein [Lachnospiraceae bacterium]MDE7358480.1 GtrA family protein [Lachnospiraceae bacterium]
MIRKLWDFGWGLYKKHEEGINYLIFGFLAFVLNYILYFIFADAIAMHYMAATGVSWVLTVVFAYWTNRTFVFKSQNKETASVVREFASFIGARVATEVLELVLMYVLVDLLTVNDKISKLACQVIVILANYVLSKIWIFRDTSEKTD